MTTRLKTYAIVAWLVFVLAASVCVGDVIGGWLRQPASPPIDRTKLPDCAEFYEDTTAGHLYVCVDETPGAKRFVRID